MRRPIAFTLFACLALAQAASAAPQKAAVNAPAKTVSAVKPASPSASSPDAQKRAACERTWKAQTKHTGKHKAFIAACVAKG